MTLLNVGYGLPQSFRHLQADQDDGQPATAQGGDGDPGELGEGVGAGDQAGLEQFVKQLFGYLLLEWIVRFQQGDCISKLGCIAA